MRKWENCDDTGLEADLNVNVSQVRTAGIRRPSRSYVPDRLLTCDTDNHQKSSDATRAYELEWVLEKACSP